MHCPKQSGCGREAALSAAEFMDAVQGNPKRARPLRLAEVHRIEEFAQPNLIRASMPFNDSRSSRR